MKKFLIHVTLFFLIIVGLDIIFGKVCSYLFCHARGGATKTNYYIARESNEPILMMGSSRMHHHYDPQVVKETTGLDAFNAGVDGNGIILQFGILELLLERYTPQLIVYDVSRFDFYKDDNTKYLENLKPFYGEQNINDIFIDILPMASIKMMSGFYRYNSKFFNLLSDCFIRHDGIKKKGYKSLKETMNENDRMEDAEEAEIDSLKLFYFNRFIDVCSDRGIILLVFVSPTYNKYISSEYYSVIKDICKYKEVRYFDFSEDDEFINNKEYYKDYTHLNSLGAKLFTIKVSNIIKEYIAL